MLNYRIFDYRDLFCLNVRFDCEVYLFDDRDLFSLPLVLQTHVSIFLPFYLY